MYSRRKCANTRSRYSRAKFTASSSMPSTSAPSFAAGTAVVPSPQPRSRTFIPSVTASVATSASPLSRMLAAIRVKSPFSQSALFGLSVVDMVVSVQCQ